MVESIVIATTIGQPHSSKKFEDVKNICCVELFEVPGCVYLILNNHQVFRRKEGIDA